MGKPISRCLPRYVVCYVNPFFLGILGIPKSQEEEKISGGNKVHNWVKLHLVSVEKKWKSLFFYLLPVFWLQLLPLKHMQLDSEEEQPFVPEALLLKPILLPHGYIVLIRRLEDSIRIKHKALRLCPYHYLFLRFWEWIILKSSPRHLT